MAFPGRRWQLGLAVAIAIAVPAAWWGWQRFQLQTVIDQAQQSLAAGEFADCLTTLSVLDPGQQPASLLNDCRWQRSQQLAAQQSYSEALQLVLLIPASDRHAVPAQSAAQEWSQILKSQAEEQFLAGNWPQAQRLLQAIPATAPLEPAASELLTRWRQQWRQDSVAVSQAKEAIAQARWWDVDRALTSLSDHPFWQSQAQSLRQQAQQSIRQLAQQQPDVATSIAEDGTAIDTVAEAELAPRFQQYLAQGLPDYEAWQRACREAGGQVLERGPESFCSRDRTS